MTRIVILLVALWFYAMAGLGVYAAMLVAADRTGQELKGTMRHYVVAWPAVIVGWIVIRSASTDVCGNRAAQNGLTF
jgi:hypothetical protein